MAEIKALPAAAPVDAEAAELLAELRGLMSRVTAGEVIGILAVLVTVDPADPLVDEDTEHYRAGIFTDDTKVICDLEALRLDLLEEWREDRQDG
jgi:cytochrome oxidase Cu insertion factor (SCO1/SenC/PrrC family)